jgi:hypothetical protein
MVVVCVYDILVTDVGVPVEIDGSSNCALVKGVVGGSKAQIKLWKFAGSIVDNINELDNGRVIFVDNATFLFESTTSTFGNDRDNSLYGELMDKTGRYLRECVDIPVSLFIHK